MRKLWNNIWLILTLDCERSAMLVSQSFDRELDWSEWIAMKLHHCVCGSSRRFAKQLTAMNAKLHSELSSDSIETSPDQLLDESAKERIKTRLRQKMG